MYNIIATKNVLWYGHPVLESSSIFNFGLSIKDPLELQRGHRAHLEGPR